MESLSTYFLHLIQQIFARILLEEIDEPGRFEVHNADEVVQIGGVKRSTQDLSSYPPLAAFDGEQAVRHDLVDARIQESALAQDLIIAFGEDLLDVLSIEGEYGRQSGDPGEKCFLFVHKAVGHLVQSLCEI